MIYQGRDNGDDDGVQWWIVARGPKASVSRDLVAQFAVFVVSNLLSLPLYCRARRGGLVVKVVNIVSGHSGWMHFAVLMMNLMMRISVDSLLQVATSAVRWTSCRWLPLVVNSAP